MSEHQLIEVNLQGMRKLESGTGYWVNEGQDFVWVGGKVQPLNLKGSDKTFYKFPFDIARARIDILARNHPINIRITFLLVRTLIYSRALDRVLSYLVSTHSRRWRLGRLQRKSTDWSDEERRWSIYLALDLYVDLLIIEGRREGQLSAWEGILLVKESKQNG